jgi:hypothetical protein
MPTKNKVGRPKLAKGKARSHTLAFRLDSSEYKAVSKAIKASFQTQAQWLRWVVVSTSKSQHEATLHGAASDGHPVSVSGVGFVVCDGKP